MAEVHFKKSDGVFTAEIKHGELSIKISFACDDAADEYEMEESLKILHANLVFTCGESEAARVFSELSKKIK